SAPPYSSSPNLAPPANQPQYPGPGFPASGGAPYGAPPDGGTIYGQPNMNPLPPPIVDPAVEGPTADLTVTAQETQTGRLMLGVGVNSDAGLIGNFVLD